MSALIADKFADYDLEGGTGKSMRRKRNAIRPVAPYHRNGAIAASMAFDRNSGDAVKIITLKTYAHALAQYHLHPENKFLKGNYLDRGTTLRRHVRASSVRHIGKEAHGWEAQAHLGIDSDAQIDYGMAEFEIAGLALELAVFVKQVGYAKAANTLKISAGSIRKLCAGKFNQKMLRQLPDIQAKLKIAIPLENQATEQNRESLGNLRVAIKRDGLRKTARQMGVDPSNLRRRVGGADITNGARY